MAEWYFVSTAGQQTGPVTQDQFKASFQQGVAGPDSLCWRDGMGGWTAVKEVPGLMAQLSPAPAPSPAIAGRAIAPTPRGAAGILAQQQQQQAAQAQSGAAWAAQQAAEAEAARKAELDRLEKQKQEAAARRAKQEQEEQEKKKQEELARVREETKRKQEAHKQQQQAVWVELSTPEGVPYYHNKLTNKVTWEKPDELKEAHEIDKSGEWVWIPDQEEGYVKARLAEKYYDGRFSVETEDGRQITLKKGTVLAKLEWSSLRKLVRDLVMLDEMNHPLILHNLRERFQKNEIYTNVGSILITLNPYKRLPLYTPTVIDEYRNRGQKQLPPHVFIISDDAYNNLIEKSVGQSIVISGESGSGKTECTKQCLQYLAEVAGSQSNIEQKILLANPILEAFGNAKTVRNNNSSRFGKYVEIYFDQKNQICGARTTNYLLEKSRVVFQQQDERNYHIFYQLCSAADDMKRTYSVSSPLSHAYLNQGGDIYIPGVDDHEELQEVLGAFDKLDFSPAERNDIFAITAAVLHLGDLQFRATGEKSVALDSKEPLALVAKYLQAAPDKLEYAVTNRTISMKGDKPIQVPLSKAEAESARDALAKFVYAKLFDWLVVRINKAIGQGASRKGKTIGILDIFGFEIFKVNSFEQLCINYANEKLQQFFNNNTFKLEESVYRQEKIDFKHVEYVDNQGVLDLIEKKPTGVLTVVDEELRMPKGTDQTFVEKLHLKHKETPQYQNLVAQPTHFLLKHYAGDVVYDSKDFLLKNKDKMGEDLFDCVTTSNMALLKSIFQGEAKDDRKAAADRSKTLGSKFAEQLGELMAALNATEPHYVRCIKPNPEKAPLLFKGGMVLEQLTYSGVFEAVEIRKRGFPFRYTHAEFYKRFKPIAPKQKFASAQKACEELIGMMGESKEVRIGVSRVLYRAAQHKNMELQRNLAVEKTVKFLQKVTRGYQARKVKKRLKIAKPILVKAIAANTIEACDAALEQCSGLPFPLKEWEDCKKLKLKLIEEKKVTDVLNGLLEKDPEEVFEQLSKAIASADEIGLDNEPAKRARVLLVEVKDRRKCRKWLEEGVADADETKLDWALKRAEELKLKAPAEIKQAQEMKTRIAQERQLQEKLVSSSASGGYLKEGDNIVWDALEGATTECVSFQMKTEAGKKILSIYLVILDLRKRMKAAIGTKDKALWKAVEQVVVKAGDIIDENQELQVARDTVARQAAVEEVAVKLQQAVSELDQEQLQFGLQQAKQLNIDEHKYPVVPVAREYLERIVTCRQLLHASQNPPEEGDLIYAVQYAESFGYETPEVTKARELRDIVMQINLDAKFLLDVLEEPEMKELHLRAEKVNLTTPDIEKIRTLLFNTPEEKFVQLQLKAAVKHQDEARMTRLTIRLKDLFFNKAGPMFKVENFPKLRSPLGWASQKMIALNRDNLAAGMRRWQKVAIHAALTELQPKQNKIAVRLFKNIMGFMGDRQYESPLILAEELLTQSLENPWLRDEIFLQLIKQLTNNPIPEGEAKGWQLLACCLETFPPQSEFENYLEMWLRANAKPVEKYISLLHVAVYKGPRTVAPNQAEITRIVNGETLRKIAFDKKKEYKKPLAQPPPKAPIGAPPVRQAKEAYSSASYDEEPDAAAIPPPSSPYSSPTAAPASPGFDGYGSRPSAPKGAAYASPAEEEPEMPPPPPPTSPELPPPPSDWQVAYHPETGTPYYYNTRTGEVTWDKPAELA